MSEYSLGLTTVQAQLTSAALDMYTRIGLGQLENILEHPAIFAKLSAENRADAEWLVHRLKYLLFGFEPNASHGITNLAVDDKARQAYDIRCVIRHRLAWDKAGNPPNRDFQTMFGVDYDPPTHLGGQPLATMQRIEKTE